MSRRFSYRGRSTEGAFPKEGSQQRMLKGGQTEGAFSEEDGQTEGAFSEKGGLNRGRSGRF